MQLSRRDFVKILGGGTGVAFLLGPTSVAKGQAGSSAAVSVRGVKAMLYDTSKCVGCRACQSACKRWNGLPGEPFGFGSLYDNPPDLSAKTWTLIKAEKLETNNQKDLLLCKYQCMHCTEAACVKVCPTGALTHHELGFVAYDPDKCSGCGYCAEFCPFHVPHLGGSTLTGLQRMQKCTFCSNRVVNNQQTACAEACPAKAIVFGSRDELIAEGRKRASDLKKSYPNAIFYGENELGGLHVMCVLKDNPAVYKLPPDPKMPGAAIAWKDVIQPMGWVLGALTILGLGLNFIVAREAKMTRELPGKEQKRR